MKQHHPDDRWRWSPSTLAQELRQPAPASLVAAAVASDAQRLARNRREREMITAQMRVLEQRRVALDLEHGELSQSIQKAGAAGGVNSPSAQGGWK